MISTKIDLGNTTLFDLFLRVPKQDLALFRSGKYWTLCFGASQVITSNARTDLQKIQCPSQKKGSSAFPFKSGGVGFLSYDLGKKLLHIPTKPNPKTPLFQWKTYTRSISENRETGEIHFHSAADEVEAFQKEIIQISKIDLSDENLKLPDLKQSHSESIWRKGFKKTITNIYKGEIYQLNLTRQFSGEFSGNARELFLYYLKKNPAPHAAFFAGKDFDILSFSPELFLRFSGDTVTTEPIKGTRPRKNNSQADNQQKNNLLNSEKEAAELLMITDLLRNDLSQTCQAGTIRVEALREIQKNPTLWHTLSRITGKRKQEFSPIDTLISCLPGGSISGCPKKRACEIIAELEPHNRGIFFGTFGFLDDSGFGEFAILIRTLLHQNEKIYFQAGGGLTVGSQENAEHEEVLQKGKVFFTP